MPVRVALTGTMKGPEVGSLLCLLKEGEVNGVLTEKARFVPLAERIRILRDVNWEMITSTLANQENEPAMSH